MLFRGDWEGQAVKLGLIPVRVTELQPLQSPVTRPDPLCPLSPQGAAADTSQAGIRIHHHLPEVEFYRRHPDAHSRPDSEGRAL